VEKAGLDVGEEFQASGVEMNAGGSEEDEGLAEPSDQFGDNGAELALFVLDGEENRDGVGGPGTDLGGGGEREFGGSGVEAEGFAEGTTEERLIELPGGGLTVSRSAGRAGSGLEESAERLEVFAEPLAPDSGRGGQGGEGLEEGEGHFWERLKAKC